MMNDVIPALRFVYTNHKGETAVRHVQPMGVRFGTSQYYLQPTHLLIAFDYDRHDKREFDLSKISPAPAE